jgi:ABC-type bacteriocin/lantibiotic exporter with double-glycine peptidase domain
MSTPLAIDPVMQKDSGDCAIAALAMVIGRPFREVSDAAIKTIRRKRWQSGGLETDEVLRIARKLGVVLTRTDASGPLDEATGILLVKKPKSYHAVVVFEGVVFNPADGLLWNLDAYCHSTLSKPYELLQLKEDA